ncbi:TBC1 domain family member 2b [Plakobranchus ocellatus]|uniref:TBC1 domain family member 2b n=1 Tax=Plakobranchus ocellatus TaxID=259542 RepID=A0AAV3YAB8_9GAST|nr:TBC1 domain family member 2b [Plakobranchus ocellatus]
MSMLTRTGTVVRKQRRRSSTASRGSSRRESAPTPSPTMCLSPSPSPSQANFDSCANGNGLATYHNGHRHSCYSFYSHLTPSPFPSQCGTPFGRSTSSVDMSPLSHRGQGRDLSKNSSFTFEIAPHSNGSFKLTPPPNDKPVYESTVLWAEVEDTDNHYSLLGSISEASNEARHPCDFIHKSLFIIGGTWPVTVFTLVLLALPLVMTAIGVNYLRECPREPKLPIYLVVGGSFGILKLVFLLWKQIRRHRDDVIDLHDDDDLLTMTRMTNMALNVFLSVWFVFGHYWLVRIWKPHFEAPLHEPRNWCDRTVFLFTFWQLVICHIILGVVVLITIALYCAYVCIKCFASSSGRSGDDAEAVTAVVATSSSAGGTHTQSSVVTRLNGHKHNLHSHYNNTSSSSNSNSNRNNRVQLESGNQQPQQQQQKLREDAEIAVKR